MQNPNEAKQIKKSYNFGTRIPFKLGCIHRICNLCLLLKPTSSERNKEIVCPICVHKELFFFVINNFFEKKTNFNLNMAAYLSTF